MSERKCLFPLLQLTLMTLLLPAAAVHAQPGPGEEMRKTQALACRDAVWQRPEFSAVPKAALTVMYGGFTPQRAWVYWIVDWRELRTAGKCWLPPDAARVLKIENFIQPKPG